MADLQVLFHNPESMTDSDLSTVKSTLRMQRSAPLLFAGAFGGAMYALNSKCPRVIQKTAVGALAGYALGGYLAYTTLVRRSYGMYSESAQASMDKDILQAFEQRYVDLSLNAVGYGNSALTTEEQATNVDARIRKPY